MTNRLQIVTWKWGKSRHPKKKITFGAEHVNIMQNMLSRHLTIPHDVVCITDDPLGLDPSIRVIPLWEDFRTKGGCFVRLKVFSSEMRQLIGPRFASIDIDAVIISNVDHIFGRHEDFLIWGDPLRGTRYCGSLFMMNAGCREEQVWNTFNPKHYKPNKIVDGQKIYKDGTDQYHISLHLKDEAEFTSNEDGIYNFSADINPSNRDIVQLRNRFDPVCRFVNKIHKINKRPAFTEKMVDMCIEMNNIIKSEFDKKITLPDNASIIFFNGKFDPSQRELQKKYPWIKEHWQ